MTEPLVSILVPTYNGERFLRPAVRSALAQTYRNIEVILVDDASTDRTPEILAAFSAEDARVRVIRQEHNVGAAMNWTTALEEARGEYVKYVLHDDVLASDCLRDLVRGMEASPEALMAFSRRVLIDEDGRPIPNHELPKLRDRPGLIDGFELGNFALESCTNPIGEATTVLFRRSAVDPAGWWQADGRQVDVLADLKLWLTLLSRGPAFYTPRVLSRFRMHGGQNSVNPGLIARGMRDWPRLIDWATRQGFLADVAQRRRAHARALFAAAARVPELIDSGEYGPSLEGAFLAIVALMELGSGSPADRTRSLTYRAHEPALLDRLGHELDVWTGTFAAAVAAPVLEPGEVGATVQAFRDILATGCTKRLLMAVPTECVDDAIPLVEQALAQGPDVDIELVPTTTPALLLREPWLGVTPPGRQWHGDKAAGIWNVELTPPPYDGGG